MTESTFLSSRDIQERRPFWDKDFEVDGNTIDYTSSRSDWAAIQGKMKPEQVRIHDQPSLEERASCLRAIQNQRTRSERVLELLALRIPNELKLEVMKFLVAQHYPAVFLREKKDFEDIVANLLCPCRDQDTKKVLKPILEEAIFKTSVIRVRIRLEADCTTGFPGVIYPEIDESLLELCGKIKHLEWRPIPIMHRRPMALIEWSLGRATFGLASLKQQFPKLLSFRVGIEILLWSCMTADEAIAGTWLNTNVDQRFRSRDRETRTLFRDLFAAIQQVSPGKRTNVISLSIVLYGRQFLPEPHLYFWDTVRVGRLLCPDIEINESTDAMAAIPTALASAVAVDKGDDDEDD